MLLTYILFIAISRVASATNSSNVPPPLPEEKWIGKSHLNYTTLHDTLGEPLLCLDVPIGVLGFYIYLVRYVMIILAFFKLAREKNKGWTTLLSGICMCAFMLPLLVQDCKTIHNCSISGHEVGKYTIPGLAVSVTSQLASLLAIFGIVAQSLSNSGEYLNIFRKLALSCYLLAAIMNILPGVLYTVYIMLAGKISLVGWLDRVLLPATLAAVVPGFIITALLVFGSIWLFFKAYEPKKALRGLPQMFIGIAIFSVCLLWTGAAYVFLGKIAGSPWGEYWWKYKSGKLDAVWIVIFPIFHSILCFW